MPHPWIPNSSLNVKREMMKHLGISDIMELFSDVPRSLILKEPLNIGFNRSLTEYEVVRKFEEITSTDKVFKSPPPFIGGGFCAHYVPAAVKALISRAEFYTAYTPYQPEVAQGLLQSIFEYQSLMAELYAVDVVNASLYNGSTAAAEAVRMALRVKRGRRKVLISKTSHPEVREVIKTWLRGTGATAVEVGYDRVTGEVSLNELKSLLNSDVAAVYIEYPNFFGIVESVTKDVIEEAHRAGALAIVFSNPIALGVLEPPGRLGADIVVGDTQPLGAGLNFGGPSAGILGIKEDRAMLRQLPGRLIGATTTIDGDELGYMMILQTREQHIRRERATSNITTNSNLMAIAAAIYTSLLGSEGFKRIGQAILGRTRYALKKLSAIDGIKAPLFSNRAFFRELPIGFKKFRRASDAIKKLLGMGIHIGPALGRFYKELEEGCLICVTELHTKRDIDMLATSLSEITSGVG